MAFLEIDKRGRAVILFGKFKGEFLSDALSERPSYFRWALENMDSLTGSDRKRIETALEEEDEGKR